MIPGVMPVVAAGSVAAGPTYELVHTAGASTFGSSFTITSANLGAAASDRIIVVAVSTYAATEAAQTVNSVTIGGDACALDVRTSASRSAAIFSRVHPAGTSANITVSVSSNVSIYAVAVYAIYGATGLDGTPNSATGTASSGSTGVNTSAHGVAIFAAVSRNAGAASWSGVAQDHTYTGANFRALFGSDQPSSAQSPLTATATFAGSAVYSICGASYI